MHTCMHASPSYIRYIHTYIAVHCITAQTKSHHIHAYIHAKNLAHVTSHYIITCSFQIHNWANAPHYNTSHSYIPYRHKIHDITFCYIQTSITPHYMTLVQTYCPYIHTLPYVHAWTHIYIRAIYYITLQYVTLRFITLHAFLSHMATFPSITSRAHTWRSITYIHTHSTYTCKCIYLRHITYHHSASHSITSHHNTSGNTTLHSITYMRYIHLIHTHIDRVTLRYIYFIALHTYMLHKPT